MKHAILLLLAICCLSVTVAWPAAAEEPTEEREANWARARALFEQGAAAFDARNYEQARWALSESLRLRKSYDTAGLLGQTEIELGRYRDSAEHLEYCIREFPISENRDLLKQVQQAFATVKQRVGTLRVTVDRAGAEVLVDNRAAGTSPLEHDLFVEPGVHKLEVRIEGASPVTRAFRVKAGEVERLHLKLAVSDAGLPESSSGTSQNSVTGSTSGGPDVTQDNFATKAHAKTWVLVAGAGLTATAVALGIGFHLAANGADDDALAKQSLAVERFGAGGCGGQAAAGSTLCDDIRSDVDRRDRLDTMSTVSFIAAGVFGAATVGTFFLWPKQASTVAVTPARVGAGAELQFRATF